MLLAAFHLPQRQHLLLDLLVDFGRSGVLDETGNHILCGDLAVADRRIHGVGVREIEFLGHADQRFRGQQRGNRQIALAHRTRQLVLAFLNRLGAAFLAEPLADLVARLRAFHEAQPVARRACSVGFRGEHFDRVAAFKFRVKRDEPPVDAGTHGAVADLGVHGIREINRRGIRRQGDDLAFRCEHVHFGSAEVLLERAKELVGIRRFAGPVGQLLDPLEVVGFVEVLAVLALAVVLVRIAQRAARLTVRLVLPVRGDAEFRPPVHVPRADLNLDRLTARPDHRGVQALVHVEFRHGDVVLEPAGDRVPPRMHGTERRIAVLDGVDDDAHADQIVDIREIVPAHDHLLVDGEVVLRASGDGRLDVQIVEILIDFGDDLLEVDVALACPARDKHDNLVVDLRVENLETQLLELGFDGVHTQSVGERRVDVQRFTRLALGVRRLDVAPRPGVVHAVGELDDEYTHVTAHGDHHFADGLRLGGIAVLHPRKFGDAVHEPGDGIAEFGSTLGERVIGVLNRVVE